MSESRGVNDFYSQLTVATLLQIGLLFGFTPS